MAPERRARPHAVLFACGMNSVRSPMAAALFQQMFGKSIYVASCGAMKGEPDPFVTAVMEEIGIDMSRHRPMTFEDLDDLEGLNFDLIVTLSPPAHHRAIELTRTLASDVEYWPTPDPDRGRGQPRAEARRLPRGARPAGGAHPRALRPGGQRERVTTPDTGYWRSGCEVGAIPLASAPYQQRIPSPKPMIGRPKFVLASGSPRRLALVNQAGIEPDALKPADIDESPRRGEIPRAHATRLAKEKAKVALDNVKLDDELRGAYILAADTVVAVGRRILPKAELLDEASQCLRLLSGRNHRVFTSICLVTPKESFRQRLVETRVRFKRLSEEDIEAYLASGEWRGKAGGYAAQGIAGTFIVKMIGSYTNIVGLPLYETVTLLGGEGYPIRFGWLNAT